MKRRSLLIALAAIAVVLGTVISQVGTASSASSAPTSTSKSFYVTLYGWPDNSPPGGDIAYPKSDGYPTLHNSAGGTGTYSNPITYATDKSELAVGTKVYYSYLKRYFIMEDDCVECDSDWNKGKSHIDLWIGSQGGSSSKVIDCEDALTRTGTVIVNPPSTEAVDTTPLFNSSTNKCYSP